MCVHVWGACVGVKCVGYVFYGLFHGLAVAHHGLGIAKDYLNFCPTLSLASTSLRMSISNTS